MTHREWLPDIVLGIAMEEDFPNGETYVKVHHHVSGVEAKLNALAARQPNAARGDACRFVGARVVVKFPDDSFATSRGDPPTKYFKAEYLDALLDAMHERGLLPVRVAHPELKFDPSEEVVHRFLVAAGYPMPATVEWALSESRDEATIRAWRRVRGYRDPLADA